MPDNFQQTVDLREQMEKRRKAGSVPRPSAPLEKIYEPEDGGVKKDLKKINRPEIKKMPEEKKLGGRYWSATVDYAKLIIKRGNFSKIMAA